MGKKHSFMCSQVDSLTGTKKPMMKLLPDHWYIKCARVPVRITNRIPRRVYFFNFFMDSIICKEKPDIHIYAKRTAEAVLFVINRFLFVIPTWKIGS